MLKGINAAIDYIEENIAGEIDMEQAAQQAGCSLYCLQQLFGSLTGMTPGAYVRRRKMTQAAFEIQKGELSILEASLKYGYQSPTAFNRVFKNVHGFPPSKVNKDGNYLQIYPRIQLQISVAGNQGIQCRVENMSRFYVTGVSIPLEIDMEKNFKRIPEFWNRVKKEAVTDRLLELSEDKELLGISLFGVENALKYMIGIRCSEDCISEFEKWEILPSQWAVLNCKGAMPQAMQMLYKTFFTQWLPVSDYVYDRGPDIEIYGEGNGQLPDYECKLSMAVKRKF